MLCYCRHGHGEVPHCQVRMQGLYQQHVLLLADGADGGFLVGCASSASVGLTSRAGTLGTGGYSNVRH
jgi:hypothetical protein